VLAKNLFSAINYADTVKLILFAAFAATVTYAADRAGAFPGWLRVAGRLLATVACRRWACLPCRQRGAVWRSTSPRARLPTLNLLCTARSGA
jgi:hypothetical protein